MSSNTVLSSPKPNQQESTPTEPIVSIPYALYEYRQELRKCGWSSMDRVHSKYMLTQQLVNNTVRNGRKYTEPHSKLPARLKVFQDNLHREIYRRKQSRTMHVLRGLNLLSLKLKRKHQKPYQLREPLQQEEDENMKIIQDQIMQISMLRHGVRQPQQQILYQQQQHQPSTSHQQLLNMKTLMWSQNPQTSILQQGATQTQQQAMNQQQQYRSSQQQQHPQQHMQLFRSQNLQTSTLQQVIRQLQQQTSCQQQQYHELNNLQTLLQTSMLQQDSCQPQEQQQQLHTMQLVRSPEFPLSLLQQDFIQPQQQNQPNLYTMQELRNQTLQTSMPKQDASDKTPHQ